MKRQILNAGFFAVMLGASCFFVGCNRQKADDKGAQQKNNAARVQEIVDVTAGKAISPQDQAKISSLGLKVLSHVAKAKEDIQAKNIDAAKKELTQARTLLDMLKEVLPTEKIMDNIWVAQTNLSYTDTTEVQQDLVPIVASIEQLYDVLPAGPAKEHAKQAKDILTKEKTKGASKAKEQLEAVEEALDFREVDLSVSYTTRLVKVAQGDLDKGKTKEASDTLSAVSNGLLFFDASVIDPWYVALRRIWLAKQDYAAKNHKAAKTRLEKAKMALEDAVQHGDKALQEKAKKLIAKIEAIDVMKVVANVEFPLEALWQDARKLEERAHITGTKLPDTKDKTEKEAKITNKTFIQAADQIDLAEVKLGKIAEDHAASDAIKKFGMRMVSDHTLMNKELREITSKKGIKLTAELDQIHKGLMGELSKLKGAEFDRVYTKDMVSGHEKAIEQFEIEAKNGSDPDVKAWAEKWLPTLREHLKLAQVAVKDIQGK